VSALGLANRVYTNIWFVLFGYAALVLFDVGLKAMGWQSATIVMLFIFLFLAFFVLLQPAILCAIFMIDAIDAWSVRGGWNASKVWITKQVPATVYLVMIIPLTITFLPIEKYFGLAALGLIVYWMIEMASIRTDANRGLIILRAIYWCIFGYLVFAGLYGTHWGQKIINESPSAQKLLAVNNPFESSKVQTEYDAVMTDVKAAREATLAKCFGDGVAEARKKGPLTDQSIIDRIKRECDTKAGYAAPQSEHMKSSVYVLASGDACLIRNAKHINGQVDHSDDAVFDAIIAGCKSNQHYLYPVPAAPQASAVAAHAEAAQVVPIDPVAVRAEESARRETEREAAEYAREQERLRKDKERAGRFNSAEFMTQYQSAKHEFDRLEYNVLHCETQSCATSQLDDLVAAADAYSESAKHVDIRGDGGSTAHAGEHIRKYKAEYVVLATLREQYRATRDYGAQRELRASINDLQLKLRR
jgi:hypothetical protein